MLEKGGKGEGSLPLHRSDGGLCVFFLPQFRCDGSAFRCRRVCFLPDQQTEVGEGQEDLAVQFRECILAVTTFLQAGYSVENAFLECRQDMALMYGEDAPICQELKFIKRGLNINISLEELLTDMAERSACDDIAQFAQIFALAKRGGGNMAEIIRNSASQIGRQIELRQEIQMLLGARKWSLQS